MDIKLKAQPPHLLLLALGLFLIFAGIRVNLIMLYGSQTPYWDDWAMGTRMAMYMESGFDPQWLYGLANEHRSTFSKVTNLFLFKFNNHQWDPYITMVFDAFMWGAIGLIVLCIGFRQRTKVNHWFFSGVVIVLWVYPLSLFNTLSTVQTYLYYMVLLTICGFWLVTHKALSIKWWCGVLLIGGACMTMGGGSFAPVAVTSVSLFLAIFSKANRRQHLITAAVAGLFAVFGLYLILSQAGHGAAESKSVSAFFTALFKTLSWPSSHKTWPSIIFLLPIGLLAIGLASQKIAHTRIATFTLNMAAFGIMLAIAIAYARGGVNGAGPAERYFDFLTIYFISSTLSLTLIQSSAFEFQKKFNTALVILWVAMCIVAAPYHLSVSRFLLNDRANLVHIQDDIMARYSVTSDPDIFKDREFREVPFPFPSILQDMMVRLHKTDTLPYSLQASNMNLQVKDNPFIINGIEQPKDGRYRGLENVLGSFNLTSGAQNAVGTYTSEVFTARRPYVMVPVSGYLGFKGTSLTLVGETNGKKINVRPKKPSSVLTNEWREILVKAPDKQFRVVASDQSTGVWFAFAAPRSVGRLSFLVNRIIEQGDKIWMFGLFLVLAAFRRQIVRVISVKNSTTASA